MRKSSFIIWLGFGFFEAFNAFAFDVLTEHLVIDSASMHFPKVYVAEEKVRSAEEKFKEARGGFDTSLNVKNRQFVSGYYDDVGYLESKIEKPLPFLNSKIYGGYTRSYNGSGGGAYPELNQYFNTRSEGRAIFGFELSLLRGFLINEKNAIRDIAKLDVNVARHNNQLMQAQVKADARKAFWKYFYIKEILKIYENGLQIALKRQEALEIQVKNGDKPEIFLEENRRVILRRQSVLENVKREMLNNAVNLTMYFRLADGEPYSPEIILSKPVLSDELFSNVKPPIMKHSMENILENRLDVRISQILLKQNDVELKLAKNDILPSVDLAVETSKDYGQNIGQIGAEKQHRLNKVAVNVTVPLENKKQRGKFGAVKAQKRIVQQELRLLKDYIANEVKIVVNRINEMQQIYTNTQEEVRIAKKLLDAENIRFENGDSDFFMVNAREQDLLAVQDYNVRNKLALTEMMVEYEFITKDSLAF